MKFIPYEQNLEREYFDRLSTEKKKKKLKKLKQINKWNKSKSPTKKVKCFTTLK